MKCYADEVEGFTDAPRSHQFEVISKCRDNKKCIRICEKLCRLKRKVK